LTAFISPFRADRDKVRSIIGERFIEVHCNTALDICESRDVKGLYKKARAGEISDFTGISSPYEAPEHPELCVNTGEHDLSTCVDQVVDYLMQHKVIQAA
ncbi:MAG: adenylyl-sulfate kinase, partial [Mariprofundaceae bacterium]|nr:adenylyl-sulfate kinase [Mariprofundaceae bacterium]